MAIREFEHAGIRIVLQEETSASGLSSITIFINESAVKDSTIILPQEDVDGFWIRFKEAVTGPLQE